MGDHIHQLNIADIIANPYQPRQFFDSDKLQELAQSITENGLLQPIIVRNSPLIGYELIAGERRLRACKLAGLTHIPAIIHETSDADLRLLAILENLQREDMSLLELARSVQELHLKDQLTHAEIGEKLGKSRSYVSNLIRILDLPDQILQAVGQGKISFGHARTLLSLPKSLQVNVAQKVVADNWSVRELELYAKQVSKDKQTQPKQATSDLFVSDLEHKLKQVFGRHVVIKTSKHYKKGEISLSFDSLDDLDKLIQDLLKN